MSRIRLFTVLGLVLIVSVFVLALVATASATNTGGSQGTSQVQKGTSASLIEFREHRMGKYGPNKFDFEGTFVGNRANWAEAGANGSLSARADAIQDASLR